MVLVQIDRVLMQTYLFIIFSSTSPFFPSFFPPLSFPIFPPSLPTLPLRVSFIHHVLRVDAHLDYFNTFWFIMVTMSTVGYGRYYPVTWIGKLLVILFIVTAILYLIPRLEELYEAFRTQQKLSNSVSVKQGQKIVLICSTNLKPVVLRDFLTEFYSDPAHYVSLFVVKGSIVRTCEMQVFDGSQPPPPSPPRSCGVKCFVFINRSLIIGIWCKLVLIVSVYLHVALYLGIWCKLVLIVSVYLHVTLYIISLAYERGGGGGGGQAHLGSFFFGGFFKKGGLFLYLVTRIIYMSCKVNFPVMHQQLVFQLILYHICIYT